MAWDEVWDETSWEEAGPQTLFRVLGRNFRQVSSYLQHLLLPGSPQDDENQSEDSEDDDETLYQDIVHLEVSAFNQFHKLELVFDGSANDQVDDEPFPGARAASDKVVIPACFLLKDFLNGKDLIVRPSCKRSFETINEQDQEVTVPVDLKAKSFLAFRTLRCPSFKIDHKGCRIDDTAILDDIEAVVQSGQEVPDLLTVVRDFVNSYEQTLGHVERFGFRRMLLHKVIEAALIADGDEVKACMQKSILEAHKALQEQYKRAQRRTEFSRKLNKRVIWLAARMELQAIPGDLGV